MDHQLYTAGLHQTRDEYRQLAKAGYTPSDVAGMAASDLDEYRRELADYAARGDDHADYIAGCIAACECVLNA